MKPSELFGLLIESKYTNLEDLWKENVFNTCINIYLSANVFSNTKEQIQNRGLNSRWILECKLVHCNVCMYEKHWEACQQLQAAPRVTIMWKSNGIHYAHNTFPLIKKSLKNIMLILYFPPTPQNTWNS